MNASVSVLSASPAESSFHVVKSWSEGNARYEELRWKDFVVTRRLAHNVSAGAEYLPSKVEQNGKIVWRFDKDGPASMVFLRDYGDEPVLILTTPGCVVDIRFVADLPKLVPIKVKGGNSVLLPVRPALELALCKGAMGEDLEKHPVFTEAECHALHTHKEAEREARRQAEATAAAERAEQQQRKGAERERERAAKIAKIVARPKLKCYTKDRGDYRHGTPVVGNEWEALRNDTFCIAVESYDDETKTCGAVIECFRVAKSGARVKRRRVEAVQEHLVTASGGDAGLEADDVGHFEISGEMLAVPIYIDVKPSLITLPRPFAVKVGNTTTIFARESESGKLKTLGIVRQSPLAATA